MPRPRVRWNPNAGQFADACGRFVCHATLRASFDRSLREAEREIVGLGRHLQRREITLLAWGLGMRRVVKDAHPYSDAATRCGWAQLSSADFGRVNQAMRQQYKHVANFAT
jgi:hypothetical protein